MRMKTSTLLASLLTTAALALFGCNKGSDDHAGHVHVDPSPIEKAFASAEPSLKETADKAVSALKKENISAATTELQKLASQVQLTDAQKKAVNDALAEIQKAAANVGKQATEGANKATESLQKSLGK